MSKVLSACFGMPSIGEGGEVAKEIASLLKQDIRDIKNIDNLKKLGANVRYTNTKMMQQEGIDLIPCGDYCDYDRMLDNTEFVGNIGKAYYWEGGEVPFDIHFMTIKGQQREKFDVQGMPIRRWPSSNYCYIVPEFFSQLDFAYSDNKIIAQFLELKRSLNAKTRPVLIGPLTYIMFGSKTASNHSSSLQTNDILHAMLPVYNEFFQNIMRLGITDVWLEEPCMVKDLTREDHNSFVLCYTKLTEYASNWNVRLHIVTSYGSIGNNLECLMSLPVASVHIDFVNGNDDINEVLDFLPKEMSLSIGVVSSQSVFVNNLQESINFAQYIADKIGKDRLIVAPSSSLFLCPMDADKEVDLDTDKRKTLAFARQKLKEVATIAKALNDGVESVAAELEENKKALNILHGFVENISKQVGKNPTTPTPRIPFKKRKAMRLAHNNGDNWLSQLPMLPIIAAGSMPLSNSLGDSPLVDGELKDGLKNAIKDCIKIQEKYLDTICAGELERVNNLEYFADSTKGGDVYVTKYNFVPLSGGEFTRLPILFSLPTSVSTNHLEIAKYCLAEATKPIKVTLQGPISFVNSCAIPTMPIIPALRSSVGNITTFALYVYFANLIGKEALKLEELGIPIIGIDESCCLAKMPLRSEDVPAYTKKLGEAFSHLNGKLSPLTQLDLCISYFAFEEYIDQIHYLDADVLLLESARSKFKVLSSFVGYKYHGDIALGMFDPSSTRTPTKQELHLGIKQSLRLLDEEQLLISTDVGFKDRTLKDTIISMETIANVIKEVRTSIKPRAKSH